MTVLISRPSPGRFTQIVVLTLTVAVFAAVVAFVTLQLRTDVRDQILRREGEALSAVASMQLANSAAEAAKLELTYVPGELADAVLKTSRLRDVLGIRVFDSGRNFIQAFPWPWSEEPPPAGDWAKLTAGYPIVRLYRASPDSLAGLVVDPAVPLLEVWVPVRRAENRPLEGAAQFWIVGRSVAAELDALDSHLVRQASLAWFAGALVIVLTLTWTFRRLALATDQLRARGEDLQRANRELVFAAKTSALGAVTAHLIHEIKNPIAGLEIFVASQAEPGPHDESGEELAAASELTRRLRAMINDVVGVLRDEQHDARFELTYAEIAELALAKARGPADARGIQLTAGGTATGALPGRRANLAGLVLRNLLQNALEAAPPGGTVRLAYQLAADGAVDFSVEDSGPGLPEAVRARLFQPCTSSKAGGSGLGLALSNQLAQQAGGRLELARSDERGTCFRLVLLPETPA